MKIAPVAIAADLGTLSEDATRATLLRAVLDAQLSPGLTVEQAAHAEVYYQEEGLPSSLELMLHWRLLRQAGLNYATATDTLADAVVLENEALFCARFPELACAAPVLKTCGGVLLYTNGLPRKSRSFGVVQGGR